MKIQLNGQSQIVTEVKTLKNLVEQFCKNSHLVIAEVNGQIIKTPTWEETNIREGDSIELVNFVGGG